MFATGFDAMTGPLLRMNITGRDGLTLAEAWQAGPRNYLGLQIAGFPNLFTITGPGSPSVLCNMPVAIEQHVEWITDCIAYMRKKRHRTHRGTPEVDGSLGAGGQRSGAMRRYCRWRTIPGTLGANVPGKPRVFMPYAGGMVRYRNICDELARKGYEGFALLR